MSRTHVLRRTLTVGLLAAGSAGLLAAPASASTAPRRPAAGAPPVAVPNTLAPGCVTFTQYKHSGFPRGHTNVYVHNTCGYGNRVKVIMTNGYDSDCISLSAGKETKFVSTGYTSVPPSVNHLDRC